MKKEMPAKKQTERQYTKNKKFSTLHRHIGVYKYSKKINERMANVFNNVGIVFVVSLFS